MHNVKLTDDDVLAIRHSAKAGERTVSLAKRFNVSEVTIRNVIRGRTFAWLGGPVLTKTWSTNTR